MPDGSSSGGNDHYMPLSHTKSAPVFSRASAPAFKEFFRSVAALGKRCGLEDAEMIDWAIRYAGDAGDGWEFLPCMAGNPTFDEFELAVRKGYPALDDARRYTHNELTRLVERTQKSTDMTREDVGDYYREFLAISQYLISKG